MDEAALDERAQEIGLRGKIGGHGWVIGAARRRRKRARRHAPLGIDDLLTLCKGFEARGGQMSKARLTSKGQITVPAEVRHALRVDVGDTLIFEQTAEDAFLVRAASGDIRRLKGVVPAPATPVTLEAMEAAIRTRARQR